MAEGQRPQAAQLELERRAGVFGVPLEAIALEVLHRVDMAVNRVRFLELLGQGIAEDGRRAVPLPVLQERALQRVARLAHIPARRAGYERGNGRANVADIADEVPG